MDEQLIRKNRKNYFENEIEIRKTHCTEIVYNFLSSVFKLGFCLSFNDQIILGISKVLSIDSFFNYLNQKNRSQLIYFSITVIQLL